MVALMTETKASLTFEAEKIDNVPGPGKEAIHRPSTHLIRQAWQIFELQRTFVSTPHDIVHPIVSDPAEEGRVRLCREFVALKIDLGSFVGCHDHIRKHPCEGSIQKRQPKLCLGALMHLWCCVIRNVVQAREESEAGPRPKECNNKGDSCIDDKHAPDPRWPDNMACEGCKHAEHKCI